MKSIAQKLIDGSQQIESLGGHVSDAYKDAIAHGIGSPAFETAASSFADTATFSPLDYSIPDLTPRDVSFPLYWQQLIVLGNGFDLQCGLRSRFGDFFKPRFELIQGVTDYKRDSWKKFLEKSGLTLWDFILQANIDDAWCDVEGAIERWVLSANVSKNKESLFSLALEHMKRYPFTDHLAFVVMEGQRLADEADDRNYLFGNLARCVWTYRPDVQTTGCTAELFIELLKLDLERLEKAFEDYLTRETSDNETYVERCGKLFHAIDADGKSVGEDFTVSTSVLSFNYTDTVARFFDGGEDGDIVNIHGKLGEDIIFGIDGKECMDNPTAVPFTKTFRLMLRGGSRTDRLISTANSANLQNATDMIKFYGHSLGKADYSYFQSIFDGVDLYESKTVLVFYYPRSNPKDDNRWRAELANSINGLLVAYGATMDNADHGKNLMHKLLLEGRLIVRGLSLDWK